ncbi:hypothetical protein KK083_01310 [Fulvivirgaceae bacterium PWU4]|uniref:Carbamoyltransferase n=1 Tax=Chryseosolibacter histidini TaxID=2782349 RepID=A0AAP2DH40_9BACT|nr:carbamoyltransferase C-terminal domain-containing protein [Chryseosolibacter histidini]MBT1695494.1 hypothetical protein [Chryseosolibacter histidini]
MKEKIIFGINLSHNMSCAVVIGGKVVVAIEEERLNRVKYCWGVTIYGKIIPYRSINYCCNYLGIKAKDVDLFVVNSCEPHSGRQALIEQLIGIDEDKIIEVTEPGHHLAHAFSSFYCSPFSEAAIVTIDVNGSHTKDGIENYSIHHGSAKGIVLKQNDLIKRGEIGIGELYVLYAALLQLSPEKGSVNGADNALASGGKLMGYASYDKRSFEERTEILDHLWKGRTGSKMTIKLASLVELFACRGLVEKTSDVNPERLHAWEAKKLLPWKYRKSSLHEEDNMKLAGEAQAVLESSILKVVDFAYEATKSENLCVAGGTMLNVVACTKILKKTAFKNLFVQPASTDAGIAIGAAMFGFYNHLKETKRYYLENDYSTLLGKTYSQEEIDDVFKMNWNGSFRHYKVEEEDQQIAILCKFLCDEKVVTLFKGRSEFGPRALGSRSFLASPLSPGMVDRMNVIKSREWYRPVAPLILEEDFNEWFDAPFERSPFMTMAAGCKEKTKKMAPSICHVDGTARPQTISKKNNPFLHKLLVEFKKKTGVPILINTSFNLRDPIVESPMEAVNTIVQNKGIDLLILENYIIEPNGNSH